MVVSAEHDKVYDEVKESYTLRSLKEKVEHYEAENKEFRQNNQLLESHYFAQRATQADILKTLHANLDENHAKIEEYEHLVEQLRQQQEEAAQDKQEELEKQQTESNVKIQELIAKNEDLQNSLDQVRDYIKRQKEVDATMEQLRNQQKEDKENHVKELSAMDRKKAIEIDQLKKDMLQKIKETRDTLRLKTKDQLDTTTKRTIMENEQMTTELAFQSREMEKLLQKNTHLIKENENLKRNVAIHKELERELARRTHVYQKVIKKLNDTSKKGDEDRRKEPSVHESRSKDQDDLNNANTREIEDLQLQLEKVQHDFSEYRHDHQTLTQLQDEATRVIIASLYDLKNATENPSTDREEEDDASLGGLTVHQREQFMKTLIEKLNHSLCSTCVPGGPPSPVTKLPKITKNAASVFSEASTHATVESKGIQTQGCDDPSFRIETSMWSWTSGVENLSKAEVVRGPLREWGNKSRTLSKRLGRS